MLQVDLVPHLNQVEDYLGIQIPEGPAYLAEEPQLAIQVLDYLEVSSFCEIYRRLENKIVSCLTVSLLYNHRLRGNGDIAPCVAIKCLFFFRCTFVGTAGGFGASGQSGTVIKFNPPNGQDSMLKNGVTTSISTRHQCITAMKEYENKSLEVSITLSIVKPLLIWHNLPPNFTLN